MDYWKSCIKLIGFNVFKIELIFLFHNSIKHIDANFQLALRVKISVVEMISMWFSERITKKSNAKLYILASDFFSKNTIKIPYSQHEFLAINMYLSFFKTTYQMIFYICTSEILKNRVQNHFFGTQSPFVFVLAGREY